MTLTPIRSLIPLAGYTLAVALPTSIALMNTALVMLLVIWVFAATPEERRTFFRTLLVLLPWFGAFTIAFLFSPMPTLKGFNYFWALLALPLLVTYLPAINQRIWFRLFAASLGAVVLLGILQYLNGAGILPTGIEGRGGFRATGTFAHALTYGAIIVFGLIVLLTRLEHPLKEARIIAAVLAPFAMAALVASGSRGAWVGLAVALPILLYGRLHRLAIVIPLVLFALALAFSAPGVVRGIPSVEEMRTERTSSVGVRLLLWEDAYEQFKERPLTGWGPYTFRYRFTERHPDALSFKPHAHNIYVHTLVETGLLGITGLFLTLFLIIRKTWRARPGPGRRAALACIAAFLASGFFEFNLGDSEVVMNLMTWIALAWIAVSSGERPSGKQAFFPSQDRQPVV